MNLNNLEDNTTIEKNDEINPINNDMKPTILGVSNLNYQGYQGSRSRLTPIFLIAIFLLAIIGLYAFMFFDIVRLTPLEV